MSSSHSAAHPEAEYNDEQVLQAAWQRLHAAKSAALDLKYVEQHLFPRPESPLSAHALKQLLKCAQQVVGLFVGPNSYLAPSGHQDFALDAQHHLTYFQYRLNNVIEGTSHELESHVIHDAATYLGVGTGAGAMTADKPYLKLLNAPEALAINRSFIGQVANYMLLEWVLSPHQPPPDLHVLAANRFYAQLDSAGQAAALLSVYDWFQTNKPTFDVLLAQIKTAEHFCTLVQQDVLAPTFGHDRQKVLVEAALAKATRELGEVRGAALSWNAPRHLTGQITSGPFSPPPLSFMEQASVLSSLSYHAFERRARRHRYFAELKKTGYILQQAEMFVRFNAHRAGLDPNGVVSRWDHYSPMQRAQWVVKCAESSVPHQCPWLGQQQPQQPQPHAHLSASLAHPTLISNRRARMYGVSNEELQRRWS